MKIILDRIRVCNTEPEPDMLIIHCPRSMTTSPWGEWAAATAEWLESKGWIRHRECDAVHIICPGHPARLQ